jgi:hypothetical protein
MDLITAAVYEKELQEVAEEERNSLEPNLRSQPE